MFDYIPVLISDFPEKNICPNIAVKNLLCQYVYHLQHVDIIVIYF